MSQQQQNLRQRPAAGAPAAIDRVKVELGDLAHRAEDGAQQLKAYGQAYPLQTVGLLVLSAFCIGVCLTLAMNRVSPAYPKETYEAHQALDSVLSSYYGMKHGAADQAAATQQKLKEAAAEIQARANGLKDQANAKYDQAAATAKAGAAKLSDSGDSLGSRLGDLKDSLLEGASDLKDRVTGKVMHQETYGEKIAHGAADLKDSIFSTASDLKDRITGKPKETGIKAKLHEFEEKLSKMFHAAA